MWVQLTEIVQLIWTLLDRRPLTSLKDEDGVKMMESAKICEEGKKTTFISWGIQGVMHRKDGPMYARTGI